MFWGEHMSVILFIHFLVILLFFNPSFISKIHLSLADIFYEHVQPNIINEYKINKPHTTETCKRFPDVKELFFYYFSSTVECNSYIEKYKGERKQLQTLVIYNDKRNRHDDDGNVLKVK